MKRKNSILGVIVLRFVGYSLGTELVVSMIETVFNALVFGVERDYPYDGIPSFAAGMNPLQIALIAVWGLLQVAVYCAGIALFARSIRRKIAEPAQRMAGGFREVSGGNLDVQLTFDTQTEFREMRDAFNRMVRKLKHSEQQRATMENQRMQLFSHIAHDLKTP